MNALIELIFATITNENREAAPKLDLVGAFRVPPWKHISVAFTMTALRRETSDYLQGFIRAGPVAVPTQTDSDARRALPAPCHGGAGRNNPDSMMMMMMTPDCASTLSGRLCTMIPASGFRARRARAQYTGRRARRSASESRQLEVST
jgi:hypothetical protein